MQTTMLDYFSNCIILRKSISKDNAMTRMISVPETLIQKISEAGRAFQDLEDELEDFLLVSDTEFIEKMRRSKEAHIEGNTRSFDNLKKELCID